MARDGNESYDLIVIGAGGAGSTAASEAVQRGAKVALIERWKVGGTCLNTGCDPTKTMVRSAEIIHLGRHAERFGIEVDSTRVDWPAVMQRVERVIDTIRGGDGDQNIRDSGVELYKAAATFRGPNSLDVGGEEIRGDKIIIATGARNVIPAIEGLNDAGYITNNEAVALPRLPRSLGIIGAGVVGVEFAQLFARFGVEVTLFGRRERVLPQEDAELTEALRGYLERDGVRVLMSSRVRCVGLGGADKVLRADWNGEQVEVRCEEILVAVGRKPAVEGLNLEAVGIAFSEDGITVDDQLRTTAENVWAIGDVTGIKPFTHVADYHARIAEHNALSDRPPRTADYRSIPHAIFTDPELGRVGMTEDEAKAAGYDVKCATVKMRDLGRAITSGETDGMVKLVADRATGQVVGGHVLAARGGELLPQIALAMRMRLPVSAIAETIHAYPTLSEAVFWAAFELAKPDDPAIEAVRGVSAPAGEAMEDV
ncbi:MAG: dihydrolipoyl dehydrogenase family protein [Thermomicrobiales bacterium]